MPTLDDFARQFQNLRVNRQGDHFSPHKPTMLLAVLALANAGRLTENRIPFSPALLERYGEFFVAVRTNTDHPNPYFPFFHLRSEPFWQLLAKPGRESVLEAMTTARSISDIENNVECATLHPDLHRLLQDQNSAAELRATLIVCWFGEQSRELDALFEYEQKISRQESILRDPRSATDCPPAAPNERPARDAAFRRVVSEAYDYRCAATGWRIILPDGATAVEAAHLKPFAESHDDDPRNGIALTPTYHWAMDKGIIAPGPDLTWHVSKVLDRRLPDNQRLFELDGTPIILPRDSAYFPKADALQWRMEKLLQS